MSAQTSALPTRARALERDSIPSLRDARWPFATILTIYGVLGFSAFGFNRTPWQMLLTVAAGMALEVVLALLIRRRLVFPLSAYISCCSLALLLNYSHQNWLLFLPVFFTIGSKYALTFERRHIFNPSMFGVACSLLLTGELITAAPAYQWAGGSITLSAFIIMSALMLFVFKIRKNWLIFSFLFFYALQTALRAWIMRHHIPPEMLFIGTVASPPFFIFTFYMITDPATSPRTPRRQVAFAAALTLVDLYLHVYESVFTFFYAAFALAGAKYVFLHARKMWRQGLGPYVEAWGRWDVLKAPALVGALGVAMLADYHLLIRPNLAVEEAGFTMTEIPPEDSGMSAEFGQVLEQTDPRLRHVSKWIMSVGSAVATGDVDGDGLLDVFLTQPLQAPKDRGALYLNRGGFRFERVEVPALARYRSVEGLAAHGIPAGATFVDYDGDGDQDLLVAIGFGPSRLLDNQLAQTGQLALVDVTDEVGLGLTHHMSLSATFLDYDRDAHLDLFVANAMITHLEDGYEEPVPFNIFDLPAPTHPEDRRALRFMHNGWHDADNGGTNELWRGDGQGGFVPAPIELPETRWSLAVCTIDVNHDGWTDLYVANDFGPDRLYLNHRGQRFESVIGELYGEVGKDTYKGMNCSAADFDRNGHEDIYISNVHHSLQAEGSLLWMVHPDPADPFRPELRDEATQRGALNERRFAWGAGAGDLNNDGWFDMVQANGMLDDDIDPRGHERKDYWYVNHKLMQSGPEVHTYADMWGDIRGRTIYPNEARRALLNLGSEGPGYFADVAKEIGIDDPNESRGVALADLDNDGDLDALITNQHGPVSLYRNDLIEAGEPGPAAHFVGLELRGDGERTHRSAVGSRVELSWRGADGQRVRVHKEARLLTGFSGQGDPRIHVGLGRATGPVEVTVHWHGAQPETFEVPADGYHALEQGSGQ